MKFYSAMILAKKEGNIYREYNNQFDSLTDNFRKALKKHRPLEKNSLRGNHTTLWQMI